MKNVLLGCLAVMMMPVAAQAEVSQSHKQKAKELIELSMGAAQEVQHVVVGQMVAQMPIPCDAFKEEFLETILNVVSVENMMPHLVGYYTEAFTERELADLVAFNKSATGQKALKVMPALMQKGAVLGQQLMQQEMQKVEALAKEYVNDDGSCKE
jgi:hypothetical protein